MARPQHTHTQGWPDYKAAIADRAKRDAAALERQTRLRAVARSYCMGAYEEAR